MRSVAFLRIAGLAVALALAAPACDGKPDPSNPQQGGAAGAAVPLALDGPPEIAIDDEVVLRAVVAAAASAGAAGAASPLPPELAKLSPRVSPVRVAVRAVHDHLIGAPGAAADWTKLLAAVEDLSRGDRTTVDAGALAPLVAAWRKWTPEERAAEAKLATRYTRALDLLRVQGQVDLVAVDGATRDLGAAPPMSAAYASCLAVRAVHAALSEPGDDVPKSVAAALATANAAFDAIGWPGGAGPFLDIAAARLEARGRTTIRAVQFTEEASAAYGRSSDALRVALNRYERTAYAQRDGEFTRAAGIAETAVQAIRATGARGPELTDALFCKGQLALAAGDPEAGLRDLDLARAEIAASKASPAQLAVIERWRATAMWFLGRYDDAVLAADAGAKAFDENLKMASADQLRLRAELDDVAGRSLVDAGRAADGAVRFRRAADVYARLPDGAPAATIARLNSADALAKSGAREPARKQIDEVLAAPSLPYQVHAQASSVLRELGDLDGAERELAAAEKAASADARELLAFERGRLAAARKDFDGARTWFAAALKRATRGVRPGDAAGQQAARIALDWARTEQSDGDLDEAARLAGEAVGHLAGASSLVDTERARKLWTDCARQRLDFGNAETAAAIRVKSGPPGTPAMKLDAALDLFLARLEIWRSGREQMRPKLDEAILALPEGALRTAAKALAYDEASQPIGELPGRGARLLDAAKNRSGSVEQLLALAARLPADEPELRRWTLRHVASRPAAERTDVDWAAWLDRYRGADPRTSQALRAALSAQDRFVALEPVGKQTLVLVATAAAGVRVQFVEGDAGLARWHDTVHNDPSDARLSGDAFAVANTAGAVHDALAPAAGQRLLLSIAPPYGPLPGDMLASKSEGGVTLFLDAWEVDWVRSPSDLVTAASRSSSAALPMLRGPDAPLRTRHAIVVLAAVDDAARARFAALVDEERKTGLDASAAVRSAKMRLRAEWKPDPRRPSVPAWACFALRGAP